MGWSEEQRRGNLQRVANNGRFLILPWVHVQGLASKILALSARQMPRDWERHYGHRPLLLETLVDGSRFWYALKACGGLIKASRALEGIKRHLSAESAPADSPG